MIMIIDIDSILNTHNLLTLNIYPVTNHLTNVTNHLANIITNITNHPTNINKSINHHLYNKSINHISCCRIISHTIINSYMIRDNKTNIYMIRDNKTNIYMIRDNNTSRQIYQMVNPHLSYCNKSGSSHLINTSIHKVHLITFILIRQD